jgi:hypothetical protein
MRGVSRRFGGYNRRRGERDEQGKVVGDRVFGFEGKGEGSCSERTMNVAETEHVKAIGSHIPTNAEPQMTHPGVVTGRAML